MDLHEARCLYADGASAAGSALDKVGSWWPRDQVEASAVSFGIALAWARTIPAAEHPQFLCMPLPRVAGPNSAFDEAAPKVKLIRAAEADTQHWSPSERLSTAEVMLDFAVLPAHPALAAGQVREFALLTMESEMSHRHGVQLPATTANGYAWDLAKLLWAPSPRRLFVARVGALKARKATGGAGEQHGAGGARRKALRGTIDTLLAYYGGLSRPDDALLTLVLPADRREYGDAMLRVWKGGRAQGEWAALFTADPVSPIS